MRSLLAALAVAIAFAAPSHAQQVPCGPHAELLKSITGDKYNEALVASSQLGMAPGEGPMMEVYAAPLGKTFTIILLRPDGISCIIVAGVNLKTFPLPKPGSNI